MGVEGRGAVERLTRVRTVTGRNGRRSGSTESGSTVAFSKVAWLPQGEMAVEDWVSAGRRFGAVARCSQWWIGDWIRYGNSQWGEKYVEAAKITCYDIGSLRNMAWVAAQFDLSLRSDRLSWSHHVLLAPLDEREKSFWLKRAVSDRLSVSDLRVELRSSQRGGRADESGNEEQPTVATAAAGARKGYVVPCPHCGGEVVVPETSGLATVA
jgi:hypothetical protein